MPEGVLIILSLKELPYESEITVMSSGNLFAVFK